MGSGASTAADEKIRIGKLVTQISQLTEGPERINLLQEVWKLCDDDHYKLPLVEQSNLLTILVTILNEAGEINEDKRLAAGCVWYLSRGVNVRLPIVIHPGMLIAMVKLIRCSDHEARLIALKAFANLTINEACEDYLFHPDVDLGAALASAMDMYNHTAGDEYVHWAIKDFCTLMTNEPKETYVVRFLQLDIHTKIIAQLRYIFTFLSILLNHPSPTIHIHFHPLFHTL